MPPVPPNTLRLWKLPLTEVLFHGISRPLFSNPSSFRDGVRCLRKYVDRFFKAITAPHLCPGLVTHTGIAHPSLPHSASGCPPGVTHSYERENERSSSFLPSPTPVFHQGEGEIFLCSSTKMLLLAPILGSTLSKRFHFGPPCNYHTSFFFLGTGRFPKTWRSTPNKHSPSRTS